VKLTPNTLTNREALQESAMPLRIALLVLPSPDLDACEVSELLPELNRSGLLSSDQIVKIEVDDFGDDLNTSFEKQLNKTIYAIDEGKVVQLSTATQSLLMMPALKAAQLRIHPHAHLAAMQHSDDAAVNTMQLALAQAKRELATVSNIENHDNLDSQQQFAAVYQLITELASRTTHRDDVNDGVTLGPKQAKSHYWFTDFHQARVGAINFSNVSSEQSQTSFILAQGTGFIAPKSLLNTQRLQFILTGNSVTQLHHAIDRLNEQLASDHVDLLSLMKANLIDYASHGNTSSLAAVLQASSAGAMQVEINALKQALPQILADEGQYKTPSGSYFTATPLGNAKEAGLAFVYPGVGTVYADMLSELHQYFPSLYARLEREGDLKSMLQADSIYHLDAKVTPAMALGDLAIAGVGSSYLLTQLLVEEFSITPNFALGYSMGEASMWASLGVWENPHELINKTQTDPLFTSVISGELTAVRKAWQLAQQDTDEEIVWNSFVVRSPSAPIEALLGEFPHAYLAIIQGDTCVIAGCEAQCKAMLAKLGKRGIAANRVTAMHTAPAMLEHGNVIDFYHQPLSDELPTDIKFISAADLSHGAPRHQAVNETDALSSHIIAKSIADTFCHTLDFTALIHSAQTQGAKLFVELGADRQNCTLIDKIAKMDRTHIVASQSTNASAASLPLKDAAGACCTVPVNAKGGSDVTSLLKALGQLISHRVPLSLQPLIDGLSREISISQLHSANATSAAVISNTQSNENTLLKGEV